MYQSTNSLHQKLKDILDLFSRAGISVVEYRDYYHFIDLVLDKPIDQSLFREFYNELLTKHSVLIAQLKTHVPIVRLTEYRSKVSKLYGFRWILSTLTIITVFLTGYGLFQKLYQTLGVEISFTQLLLESFLYVVVFLGILLSHELGHLLTSKRSSILADGPILIPAPPIQLGFLGTLGAVIFVKTPPVSRKDLAKLGISGPLAGFIAATIIGVIGVHLSPIIPSEVLEQLIESGRVASVEFASLMFILLIKLASIEGSIYIHPLFFASYIIYIITFLNLLPIGQLDGGHVVRSIVSNRIFAKISLLIPLILLSVGTIAELAYGAGLIYTSLGILSIILYLVIGRHGHPGVANQYDNSKCPWCILTYLVLLVLTFPIPIL
ncbi:MAG: site-2 protease family protein [Desulfurococcaceae archaeon]